STFAALRYWQRHISRSTWFDREREIAVVICLDTKFVARAFALVGFGTLNECIVHPRDVFRAAIALNSFAIILAHNHPSGDPAPCSRDSELIAPLRAASDRLIIRLL